MYESLIIVIVEYFDDQISVKGLLCLLTLGVYYVLNSRFQPYFKKVQNRIDQFTALVCFATIFFGIMIHDQQESTTFLSAGLSVIMLLNVIYNFMMIRLIAASFLFKMNKQIDQLKKRLRKKLPIIKIFLCEFKKPIKTVHKWIKVRRLTARYLREKERRKFFGDLRELTESFNLSLADYDPKNVGARRENSIRILKRKNCMNQKDKPTKGSTETEQEQGFFSDSPQMVMEIPFESTDIESALKKRNPA